MSTKSIDLRPYQREALQSIKGYYQSGVNRQLVILPTGTGKTVLAAGLANLWVGRVLMLAHREELIYQSAKTFRGMCDKSVDIEMSESEADPQSGIVVATIQTLSHSNGKRLVKFDPDEKWLIISDESHRSVGESYQIIYDYFKVSKKNPRNQSLHLGITATPLRHDNKGLEAVYDVVAYKKTLLEMIHEGWLCDIKAYAIRTDTDLSHVARRGDFVSHELEQAVNQAKRNALAVKAYIELANNTKAIVFCVDIAHAKAMAKAFQDRGLKAEEVSSKTPKDERRDRIQRFRSGALPILVGVGIFVEGFDVPDIETVVMARPTLSGLFFAQAIGRGCRTAPGKTHMTLIDLVDNSSQHDIIGISSLTNLPHNIRIHGQSIAKVHKVYQEIAEKAGIKNPEAILNGLGAIDFADLELIVRDVDLFKKKIRDPITRQQAQEDPVTLASGYHWTSIGMDFHLRTPTLSMFIETNSLGLYNVQYRRLPDAKGTPEEQKKSWILFNKLPPKSIGQYRDIREAFRAADTFLSAHPDAYVASRKMAWRQHMASENQIKFLKKLGSPIPQDLTKGQAAMLIDSITLRNRYGKKS